MYAGQAHYLRPQILLLRLCFLPVNYSDLINVWNGLTSRISVDFATVTVLYQGHLLAHVKILQVFRSPGFSLPISVAVGPEPKIRVQPHWRDIFMFLRDSYRSWWELLLLLRVPGETACWEHGGRALLCCTWHTLAASSQFPSLKSAQPCRLWSGLDNTTPRKPRERRLGRTEANQVTLSKSVNPD